MINLCGVCGSEKSYDDYHRMYRRCDLCKTKHALKYYYNKEENNLEKKNHYHNNKEIFSEKDERRKGKISDLENQIKTLT